jgi:hypothetical protein
MKYRVKINEETKRNAKEVLQIERKAAETNNLARQLLHVMSRRT